MAKLEQSYESIIIVSTKVGEEGTKALVEKFTKLITDHSKADSVTVDEWGKRRLAYPINYEHEGYYVKFDFTSAPDFPAELDPYLQDHRRRDPVLDRGAVRKKGVTKLC